MTLDPTHRSRDGGPEPFEDGSRIGPRVSPLPVGPVARLRSPIMERRRVEPLPARVDRPGLELPPPAAFSGLARFTVIVSAPVLLFVGVQAALLVAIAAPLVRVLRDRADRTTISLGEGFLPYRAEMGWPQGVQEDDDVRWNWSAAAGGGGAAG